MFPSPFERLRSLPLEFYPGWHLLEGLARYSSNAAGVFRMLIGPDDLLLLDGTSPPIHDLNTRALRLDNNRVGTQYLRFFCGAVHGEAGPFSIVERIGMLKLNPALGADEVAQVKAAVRPVRRGRGASADVLSAAVLHGGALFRTRFRVQPQGMVEMLDDERVAAQATAEAGTHDGIWEVFEEPAIGQRRARL